VGGEEHSLSKAGKELHQTLEGGVHLGGLGGHGEAPTARDVDWVVGLLGLQEEVV